MVGGGGGGGERAGSKENRRRGKNDANRKRSGDELKMIGVFFGGGSLSKAW